MKIELTLGPKERFVVALTNVDREQLIICTHTAIIGIDLGNTAICIAKDIFEATRRIAGYVRQSTDGVPHLFFQSFDRDPAVFFCDRCDGHESYIALMFGLSLDAGNFGIEERNDVSWKSVVSLLDDVKRPIFVHMIEIESRYRDISGFSDVACGLL